MKTYDPYELMMIPQNKKAEMIIGEIKKDKPNLNLVNDLIVLGANLDWQDEDNYGFAPLHLATSYMGEEIAQMLIDAGANVNVQDDDDERPLHWAAMRGNVEIARMLIDAGADKDLQDKWDQTPLHNATRNGDVEIVKMLIDAGARKDIRDDKGRLPYDLAKTKEMKTILRIM